MQLQETNMQDVSQFILAHCNANCIPNYGFSFKHVTLCFDFNFFI
jgi:hypothetical protein